MMLETVATSTALRDVSANVSVLLLQILRVSCVSLVCKVSLRYLHI